MTTRRDFLARTIGASSLLAVGGIVPEFLANTAMAAEKEAKAKDTMLVVVELTGGNDGLNMVAPYGDDLYQKARPTIAHTRREILKIDNYIGLHPTARTAHRAYAAPMTLWDALRALWAFFVLIGHFFLWLFNLGR